MLGVPYQVFTRAPLVPKGRAPIVHIQTTNQRCAGKLYWIWHPKHVLRSGRCSNFRKNSLNRSLVFNLDFRCLKDSWWWKFLENGYFFEKVPSLSNRDVVLVSLTVTVFQMMICTPSYLNSHFRSTYFIFQNYSFAAREPRGKMLLGYFHISFLCH